MKIDGHVERFMIRIGFHTVPARSNKEDTLLRIDKGGLLIFKGEAHIGRGSRLYVASGGLLVLGDNFAISASSTILCYKQIVFGKDIQFSWGCLVMDSDTHIIYSRSGELINGNKIITFGNKVWIGCNSMILKGSSIPSNCVIGANSLVSGGDLEENSIIVGNPARSIKKIGTWVI